jgi:hypothetical protein
MANSDALWNAIQTQRVPEMPFEVAQIPDTVLRAWSELESDMRLTQSDNNIMFPYRLLELAKRVTERPLISADRLVQEGVEFGEVEARLMESIFPSGKNTNDQRSQKKKGPMRMAARKAVMEGISGRDKRDCAAVEEVQKATATNANSDARKEFLRINPLSKARIRYSRSSKLNYIISEAGTSTF